MFIEASFWQCFGLTAIGVVVGMLVTLLITFALNDRPGRRQNDRLLNIDFAIGGGILLVISVVILLFTAPISHWFEICLIGFGVSGFAGRWLGLGVIDLILDRVNNIEGWVVITFISTVPTIVVSILVGVVNHYWLQAL